MDKNKQQDKNQKAPRVSSYEEELEFDHNGVVIKKSKYIQDMVSSTLKKDHEKEQ